MAGFLGFLVGDDLVDQILAYAEQLKEDYTRLNFLCDAFHVRASLWVVCAAETAAREDVCSNQILLH